VRTGPVRIRRWHYRSDFQIPHAMNGYAKLR
jgi:hypothetical protein